MCVCVCAIETLEILVAMTEVEIELSIVPINFASYLNCCYQGATNYAYIVDEVDIDTVERELCERQPDRGCSREIEMVCSQLLTDAGKPEPFDFESAYETFVWLKARFAN